MRKVLAVFAGLGVLFAVFAGLALAVVVGLLAAGTLAVARLSGRLQPAMAKASTTAGQHHRTQEYRVWNDGRGTIIDM
ncbi:hypothetical protein PZ897_08685 [Hoeflea sp. YIM 152468]|uniref:hypothetical protein n=1 Tax=Hoeflea sp. YIM 152468 TaxID=3031759 RepID=UPI0023DBD252|nr:hypothetical protein [Hoeflea sp. YIM 152468]MDF1608249.1 hypothetical protein [Hoeflea sp. YIM 152468]